MLISGRSRTCYAIRKHGVRLGPSAEVGQGLAVVVVEAYVVGVGGAQAGEGRDGRFGAFEFELLGSQGVSEESVSRRLREQGADLLEACGHGLQS